MRIIVDVMGGDNAPLETVKGVCAAAAEYNASYIIVGDKPQIEKIAEENGLDLRRFEIVHTETVIGMEDDPLSVVRAKSDSSMSVGLRLLAEGKGDAFVSTGNTGALFTGATLIVRKIKGIQRAALAMMLPTDPPLLLLDCGANVVVNDEYLEQFAVMGSAYMKKMYRLEAPRVGLLNNGTEECKGTELQITAYKRLSVCDRIHFVGNVEGHAIPQNVCDVLVTDGFTGNVVLKTIEGVSKLLMHSMKDIFYANALTKMSALMVKSRVDDFKKRFDATEHGGAPLLGISRPVIKAHGSSNANAFKNAIRQAIAYGNSGVIYDIVDAAAEFAAAKKAAKEAEAISEK
ncbi:MAG: phosphate acyltransferase PlsX [Ruminococcaceae bacterium]|nr:phosphate acyltransferase PlsX [Oscillospiraceae bacterium]